MPDRVDVRIENRPAVTLAVRRATTTPAKIGETIGRLNAAVIDALGGDPDGPMVVRWIEFAASVEMELGYPVEAPAQGLDLVRIGGGTMAVAVHVGTYDGLAQTASVVHEFVAERGRIAGPPMDIYLNDPDEVEQVELRTEVVFPIVLD